MVQLEIPGSDDRPIHAIRHGPQDAPAVLVAHGFKGFKVWGMFPFVAERLAAAGLQAIRFDFSHNGVEATDFDRLDLFLLDTWTRHQEDLAALAATLEGPFGVLGHSRGGGDAILFAAGEPRVAAVATLAAVATTLVPADAEDVVRRLGYYPIENSRTKQVMPMARTVFDDAANHSIEEAARGLDRPLLLFHGTADESVPIEHARRLASWCEGAEKHEIEGAGHTFGAVHPFRGPTPDLEAVLDLCVPFFLRTLT